MAVNETFDVAVIGSGPGGYVAAIRAGQLGLKTAIVERDPFFGGTCLHRGCIPTKAFLHTADLLDEIRHAGTHGITGAGEPRVDMPKLMQRKEKVVGQLAQGVKGLLRKNKVQAFTGRGTLASPQSVAVTQDGKESATVRAKHIVLATGSEVREIPSLETDGKVVINSDHILKLTELPANLLVIGAGAVGVEFASVYARFGVKVTLVEMLDRLVPIEDEEVSKELERSFASQGIECRTGTTVTALTVKQGRGEVTLKGKDKEEKRLYERVLVAVGRKPNTDGIGLEQNGVRVTKETVDVDGSFRTSVPSVFAIGDIIKGPWLAHAASHEGIQVMHEIAGKPFEERVNFLRVPNATYCFPEVASIGLTERQARERGHDVKLAKFPFLAIGKALILGQTEGFVKIVSEKKYEEVLGVHIIGPRATELISPASVALAHEATAESLAHAIQAHPTLGEAIGEAAHGVHGMAIHF